MSNMRNQKCFDKGVVCDINDDTLWFLFFSTAKFFLYFISVTNGLAKLYNWRSYTYDEFVKNHFLLFILYVHTHLMYIRILQLLFRVFWEILKCRGVTPATRLN